MEKRISATTTLLGLIGSPVKHSKSPAIHNAGFQKLGLDYAYLAFDVKKEQVEEFVRTAKLLNMRGFNVTMPCKAEVAKQVDELSPAAEVIGATNTVVNENGQLVGYNTDGIGFVRNLQEHGVEIKGKTVTLMGGGGAGAAIYAQAVLDGAEKIFVFNRKGDNFIKLENMAQKLKTFVPECKIEICDIQEETQLYKAIGESQIIVNATNVGMAPNENESLIKDTSIYREDHVVAEIIYNPIETKMMKEAKEAGVRTVIDGRGMLQWQAVEAFRLFTGQEMPIEAE